MTGLMPSKGKDHRYLHIDALRGAAAVAVLINHCSRIAALRAESRELGELIRALGIVHFDLGRFGVVLFFMISGFVIPFSLKGDHAVQRFAISRLFRLYPAYWLSISAAIGVATLLDGPHFTLFQIMANATMITPLWGVEYLSGVYWTLFIEVIFYLVCAALYTMGVLRNPLFAFLAGLGFALIPLVGIAGRLVGLHLPIIYLCAHLSFLFMGYLIRLWMVDGDARAQAFALTLLVTSIVMIPILVLQPGQKYTISTLHGTLLASLAAVGLFLLSIRRPFLPPTFAIWLGAISYSLYLFHTEVGKLVHFFLPEAWGAVAFVAVTAAGSMLVAHLAHVLVEKPAIAMGRTLSFKLNRSIENRR